MKIRTLLVDDMEIARDRIRRFLTFDSTIEIIGECCNGRQAIEAIRKWQPDLVFLDVQMPEIDGFQVVERIGVSKMPVVVFVTAHDQFALRAFEVSALDYILKPFEEERFGSTLERVKHLVKNSDFNDTEIKLRELLTEIKHKPKYLKRLAIKVTGKTVFLHTDEIDWIESSGNYLQIYAGKAKYLIREKLKVLETRLDPEKFVRIHRATIMNIERVREMHPLFNGDQEITLSNGARLTMSRTFRENLFSLLDA
jgi:two-component system LytT family response regulator